MKQHTIVVCGATGNQGLAVCKRLLQSGRWNVVALTRNVNAPKANELRNLGASILTADTNDQVSLLNAFKNAYAVFGVTQPWSSDYKKCDIAGELQQGRNIINAARLAGVTHLVFSSIINLNNQPTGVSHVDSKLELEQLIKDKQVPYTILRCAQFMDNIGANFFPVKNGKIKGFIAGGAKVPYIACTDIGNCAEQIFSEPALHLGKTYDLIGDFISGIELATLLEKQHQRKYTYSAAPAFLLRWFAPEFYSMRRWFESFGYAPYPEPMRRATEAANRNFKLTSAKDYLQKRFANH